MSQYWMPLPGGQVVPLDAMGQPDFSRMMAGTDLALPPVVAAAAGGTAAGQAVAPQLRLVSSNVPTFRATTTVRDPRWLIFGIFALALLLAADR